VSTSRQRFAEFFTDDTGKPPTWEWAICGECRGHGSNSAHLGDVTQWLAEDPDAIEDYMSGMYDQRCPGCGGSGKVHEFTGDAAEQWAEWAREEAADAYTRRMESGVWG
jgi:hypothetical protein